GLSVRPRRALSPTAAPGARTPAAIAVSGRGAPRALRTAGPRAVNRQRRSRPSLLRLGHRPEIRLVRLEALRVLLLRVLVGHVRRDDDVLAGLPVHRRGDRVLRGELAGVEEPQHLVE